uniref:Uncharacterized protein n=1 Tax=Acrobeloides nanus TaxID=290746 RepID=A0A914CLL4_9BILA
MSLEKPPKIYCLQFLLQNIKRVSTSHNLIIEKIELDLGTCSCIRLISGQLHFNDNQSEEVRLNRGKVCFFEEGLDRISLVLHCNGFQSRGSVQLIEFNDYKNYSTCNTEIRLYSDIGEPMFLARCVMFFHELKNLGRHPDFSTSQTQTSNEVRTRFTQVPETPFMNVSTQVSIKTRNAAIQIDHEKRQDRLDASTQTEFPTNEGPFTTTHKRVILRLFAYIMYQVRIRLAENLDKKKPLKRPVLSQPNKISGLKLKSTQKTPQVIDRKLLNKMIPPAVRIAQEKQIRFMRDHIKKLAELHRLQQNQDKNKQKPILEETHPIDPGHQQKFKKVIKTTKTAESKPFTGIDSTNKNKKIGDSIPIRSVLSGSAKPETSKDESSQVGNSIIDNIVKQVESKSIQSESVVKFDADAQTSVRENLVNATSIGNSSTRPEVLSSRTNKSSKRSNNRDTSESSSSSNNSRKPTSETETSKQSESNATESSSQTNESTSQSSEESTSEESSSSSTSKTTNSSKTSSDSSKIPELNLKSDFAVVEHHYRIFLGSSSASTVSSIPSENVTAPASISSSNSKSSHSNSSTLTSGRNLTPKSKQLSPTSAYLQKLREEVLKDQHS